MAADRLPEEVDRVPDDPADPSTLATVAIRDRVYSAGEDERRR